MSRLFLVAGSTRLQPRQGASPERMFEKQTNEKRLAQQQSTENFSENFANMPLLIIPYFDEFSKSRHDNLVWHGSTQSVRAMKT